MHLVGVDVDVTVPVANLGELCGVGAAWNPSREIGLQVNVQVVGQVARENQPGSPNQEILVIADRTVPGMLDGERAVFLKQRGVVAELRVAPNTEPLEPLLALLFRLLIRGLAGLFIDRGDRGIFGLSEPIGNRLTE